MAYVVARRGGQYEIRESIVTERGPRARTLANFSVLSEDVMRRAELRAVRPFDRRAVAASAHRRGALLTVVASQHQTLEQPDAVMKRFVEGARRFALAAGEPPQEKNADPGVILIELLQFADEVARHQPPRDFEPLLYPVIRSLMTTET